MVYIQHTTDSDEIEQSELTRYGRMAYDQEIENILSDRGLTISRHALTAVSGREDALSNLGSEAPSSILGVQVLRADGVGGHAQILVGNSSLFPSSCKQAASSSYNGSFNYPLSSVGNQTQ